MVCLVALSASQVVKRQTADLLVSRERRRKRKEAITAQLKLRCAITFVGGTEKATQIVGDTKQFLDQGLNTGRLVPSISEY
jgi:hypothetical protein